MVADLQSREQRLRKQAELQSLYLNLSSLREREASYIAVSAAVPELLSHQIDDLRRQINQVEDELLALGDESLDTPARRAYADGLAAEQSGDYDAALKLYRQAARTSHPDADAAIRSVRYKIRAARRRPAGAVPWMGGPAAGRRFRLSAGLVGLVLLSLVAVTIAAVSSWRRTPTPPPVAAATPTAEEAILIVPPTATPTFTPSPVPTPTFTDTPPPPTPTPVPVTPTPTMTPSPTATLRPPPQILEPKDGLVWYDGAIVFEFKEQDLAYDELYCLNTMRGYDRTLTENWSYPPTGSKKPAIPIEANVFRVAQQQGMQCIAWSAAIGKGSCSNIISESTEIRIIGLPRPCTLTK